MNTFRRNQSHLLFEANFNCSAKSIEHLFLVPNLSSSLSLVPSLSLQGLWSLLLHLWRMSYSKFHVADSRGGHTSRIDSWLFCLHIHNLKRTYTTVREFTIWKRSTSIRSNFDWIRKLNADKLHANYTHKCVSFYLVSCFLQGNRN